MKRRLILTCSLAVVIALGAYMAYALVEGAAPFAKASNTGEDVALTGGVAVCHPDAQAAQAAGAPSTCAHNCNPADCQKCPNMQGGKCVAGGGRACASSADGKCPQAGNCICPKGPGCPGMTAGKCQGAAAAGCQTAASGSASQSLQTGNYQVAGGCQAAQAAGMCGAKSACGTSCPITK